MLAGFKTCFDGEDMVTTGASHLLVHVGDDYHDFMLGWKVSLTARSGNGDRVGT